jgi:transcriptional regulator with XRE-family HTH domain
MYKPSMKTYLEQLKTLASDSGWKLKEACIDAGIADTTYYRWMNGTTSPRYKQAQQVENFLLTYKH